MTTKAPATSQATPMMGPMGSFSRLTSAQPKPLAAPSR